MNFRQTYMCIDILVIRSGSANGKIALIFDRCICHTIVVRYFCFTFLFRFLFRGSDNVPATCCQGVTEATIASYIQHPKCTSSWYPKNFYTTVSSGDDNSMIFFIFPRK